MYFSGELSIDPSQMTIINPVKPSKAFGKLFYFLTAGALSEKEEQETFSAVAILQQINRALRTMGINNIVHLAKDEIDFYLDAEGRENDLRETMESFRLETDRFESELFEKLYLVIEHTDNGIKYLIKIAINRIHKVGEYPIKISVNGVLTDFAPADGESAAEITERMKPIFQSQEKYDTFRREKQALFNLFIDQLALALRTYIQVDDLHKTVDTQIIRPKKHIKDSREIEHERYGQPIYGGYYGYDSLFFYAFLWSAMSHNHHIHYDNVTVVDSHGQEMFSVGEEGFNAGDGAAMNPEADFTPPESGDITYFGDNEFASEFSEAGLLGDASGLGDTVSDSGWLDGFDFGGGDFSGCSSCSSCGGA